MEETWDEPGTHEFLAHDFSYETGLTLPATTMMGKGNPTYKGGGKRKSKKGFGKSYGGGNLSLEDRRQRLAELKKGAKCQARGQKGHWAGELGHQASDFGKWYDSRRDVSSFTRARQPDLHRRQV